MNNERMNNEQRAKHWSLSHCSLFIVLAAFAALGAAYSLAVPIFEAPDELQHYATVQYIARYAWFPPVGSPGEHLWDQEALQSPLYYWLSAAATFWIDTSDFSKQAVLQPKPNIGDATLPGKKNAFLHGGDQAFPYRGTTLAVHIARWVSLLFGVGTVLLTFAAARFVFSSTADPEKYPFHPLTESLADKLSLLAVSFLAFIPQFVFINSVVSNDPAVTFTSTLTFAMLLWIARDGATRRRAALLGVAIGLMCLSKLIGTALAIVAILLLLAMCRRLDILAITLAAAVAISGWWYARNQIVYGDPLALGAFLRFVGANFSIPPVSPQFLWDQFRLLRFSTWGLFGHISVLMEPTAIYWVYDALALFGAIGFAVGVVGLFVAAVRRAGLIGGAKAFAMENRALLIAALWCGAVLAIAARWFFAAGIQGRLIFPALPAGAILIVFGLRVLIGRWIPARALAIGLGIPMAVFAAAVIPLYLIPAYSPPPVVKGVPADAAPVNAMFADEIELRGYTVARRGDQLRMTFYWEALKTPSYDYTVAVRLVRSDGSFWLDYVNYPGMGTSFPTAWKPAEIRQDEYVFDVDRFPAAPEPLRLIVGFYDSRVHDMIPVSGWGDVREKGWVTLTEVRMANDE